MAVLPADHPDAVAAVETIKNGDVAKLRELLAANPDLATSRISGPDGKTRYTLLHAVADWPGHFPNGPATVAALVEAGADVNATFVGPHAETPLHGAASSDDVPVLDALIDAGADLEASGGVIGGGPPLADAVAFGQWNAARKLVERGAGTALWQAAALGLTDRMESVLAESDPPPEDLNMAFWFAAHGGQRAAAELLLEHGADVNWVSGWDRLTPLDAARRSNADELVEWLRERGGKTAAELG